MFDIERVRIRHDIISHISHPTSAAGKLATSDIFPIQHELTRLTEYVESCILSSYVLHKMILNDQEFALSEYKEMSRNPARHMQDRWIDRCDKRRRKVKEIHEKDVHLNLQHHLMEHI